MTIRQRIHKLFYPFLMLFPSGKVKKIRKDAPVPPVDFFALNTESLDGKKVDVASFRGKKLLLVNTASDCGYTEQLSGLEKLYQTYKGSLHILAFPSNDFKEQEKGTDEEIAQFCQKNYGLSFGVMKKSVVKHSPDQNPVYQWLSHSASNGWNDAAPIWNFSKYLVDDKGRLLAFFGPGVDPFDPSLVDLVTS